MPFYLYVWQFLCKRVRTYWILCVPGVRELGSANRVCTFNYVTRIISVWVLWHVNWWRRYVTFSGRHAMLHKSHLLSAFVGNRRSMRRVPLLLHGNWYSSGSGMATVYEMVHCMEMATDLVSVLLKSAIVIYIITNNSRWHGELHSAYRI